MEGYNHKQPGIIKPQKNAYEKQIKELEASSKSQTWLREIALLKKSREPQEMKDRCYQTTAKKLKMVKLDALWKPLIR